MNSLFKLGLVSISFRPLSVEEIIRLVDDARFDGVEWGGDQHVPHGDLKRARDVARLGAEAGLEVSAYGSYYRFEDCASAGDYGPDPIAVLDTAKELGAPSVRIWAGQIGSANASEHWWQTVVDRTRELAGEASARGLRLDFEFHDNSLTDTNESTLRLLNDVDHPAVGAFWQTPLGVTHTYRLEGLKSLIGHVSNIHCNYFGDNLWPGMRPLEEGEQDWREYLEVLEKSDRPRWLSIEHVKDHDVNQFPKDAATLKRWVGR